ncbi:hypothetical protein ACIAD0141 [Acinetobacter baylyi ADP1]|uniref:Uncharacterized protein n=1 Tax=Acinetobacter baylyi (strain ATCC 33305 / BD413 / ADP1) TaxID=62977 RepID=Q6FFP1_ACIAD|nr:hypothetical protein ACIAD0141 [Acinetobacter baylyi ADP1]
MMLKMRFTELIAKLYVIKSTDVMVLNVRKTQRTGYTAMTFHP